MIEPSEEDRILLDAKLAEGYVRGTVPDELKDVHVIVLWSSNNATCGTGHIVVISGEAVKEAAFSRSAIIGITAHESAHLWLRAHKFQGTADDEEREADRLVCEWGLRAKLLAWFEEYNRVRDRMRWKEIREPPE